MDFRLCIYFHSGLGQMLGFPFETVKTEVL